MPRKIILGIDTQFITVKNISGGPTEQLNNCSYLAKRHSSVVFIIMAKTISHSWCSPYGQ